MLNLAAADRSSSVTSDLKYSASTAVLAVEMLHWCLLTPTYHVEGVYIYYRLRTDVCQQWYY